MYVTLNALPRVVGWLRKGQSCSVPPVFPTVHSDPTLCSQPQGELENDFKKKKVFVYFGGFVLHLISELGQLIMQLHVY